MAKAKHAGGRPSGEKTRCGEQWTEAKFRTFIKNLLRSGTIRWGPIQKCIKDARVRRGFYLCACCGEEVSATIVTTLKNGNKKRVKNILVDHKIPVVDEKEGFSSWDEVIERMFTEQDNLDAICHSCHSTKSAGETKVRTEYKALHKKYPREYNSWRSARKRTRCTTHHKWEQYGGRGITFCEEWDDFSKFLEDMGERPEGYTLNRIDNDGNYCTENCDWADVTEQNRNRGNVLMVTAFEETKTIVEWAEHTGIPYSTIWGRLRVGYQPEEAMAIPFIKRKAEEKLDAQL